GTIGRADVARVTETGQGTIRFYSSWPLTGASEQIGGDSVAAVQMALEDFGGAAGGFAIEYEALDDGLAQNNGAWDAGKEAENANRVVNDPDAMVYIATYNSGAAAISIPIMNEAGMAMISPANTYPGLTQAVEGVTEEGEPDKYYPTGNRNYMRPTVADHLQGGATANWAIESGLGSAYILHDNQLYGKGLAQAFRVYYEQLGGEVAGFEAYQPDAPDFQALATSIADRAPAMVYIGAIVNLNPGKLVQDLRSVMPPDQVTIVVPDGCFNQAFIESAGEAGEGTYVTFGGVPPVFLETEVGQDWLGRIRDRIGHDPDAYATYAYESAIVAMQAIDQVRAKDRQQILDAMFATANFNGLSGSYSFTETGDPDRPAIFLGQIRDGGFERVNFITPPTT
ncbi:MAG: branched-chain amino acid ABC transporter substrate-binding protein, partial [Chloroflexota bacterium]|nr:branched-chain amino acid ABC transporter substrate-binding protein [Chloroflexota bacterium]